MNTIKTVASAITAVVAISTSVILFIQQEEGYGPKNSQGLYVAYPDPGYGWKIPTICNGHTRGVYKGMTATEEQCRIFLKEDLGVAAGEIKRCVKTPVNQPIQDAIISFTYNTGAICRTAIPRLLSEGKCWEAAKQLNEIPMKNKDGTVKMYKGEVVMQYTTSAGIPLKGLISRRAKERVMFEYGCKLN